MFYYWNDCGPYTKRQLLYAFYHRIRGTESRVYSRRLFRYIWTVPDTYGLKLSTTELCHFFSAFRHNPNDHYKTYLDDYFEVVESWQKQEIVTDTYGRVINSADLRLELCEYVPDISDKLPRVLKPKQAFFLKTREFIFRNGPVPRIRKWKNGEWHQRRGNHGHTVQELRQYYRDVIQKKEIRDEYGIILKIHRNATELNPWNHGHHSGTHGKGWKRSKKTKQWQNLSVNQEQKNIKSKRRSYNKLSQVYQNAEVVETKPYFKMSVEEFETQFI